MIENGFNPITSDLLVSDTVVCLKVERRLSANLEIYLECKISDKNIKVLGRTIPGFTYKELMANKPIDESVTKLVSISGEIIFRNMLFIYGRIIDLNFIRFEFVCELC